MSGKPQLKRSIKNSQLGLRSILVDVIGLSGTPIIAGHNKNDIKQVIDVGTGKYTLIFKKAFNPQNSVGLQLVSRCHKAEVACEIFAQANDRITIQLKSFAAGAWTAADGDVTLHITGSDERITY